MATVVRPKPKVRKKAAAPEPVHKGLTLRKLVKVTEGIRMSMTNPENCTVKSMKPNMAKKNVVQGGKKQTVEVKRLLCQVSDRNSLTRPPVIHDCEIIQREPGDVKFSAKNVNLVVSCDCEHFLYNCEYALTKYKASWIRYCNGQPPRVTNAGLIPYVCKHLLAVLYKIVAQNK